MEIEGFPLDVNTLDSLGVTFKDNLNQLKNEFALFEIYLLNLQSINY